MHDYIEEYINAVELGQIKVGKKIQQAIDRHKRDLEKSKSDDYPYVYDVEKTRLPIKFIESLPDPKSMKPNQLALFQKFLLCLIFGWVNKETSYRRFRKAYISLARKQGKSLIVAGIALYMLIFERNPRESRQIYTTANKRDQAKIVFNMVKKQLKGVRAQSKSIKSFTKILQTEIKTIDDSFISPLSSDADMLDGLDTLCGIFDEYALSRTTDMMDVIEKSMSQQDEPLILIISTASSKLNYPMHAIEYPYISKLLDRENEDEEYLALCWEQDSMSELSNEDEWIKSNPLLEIGGDTAEKMKNQIRKLIREGKQKGTLSNVITKHFNMWVQASKESYMNKEDWEAVKVDEISIYGREVYFGLDMSRSGDNTAISWIVPLENNKFYMDSHSFIAVKGAGGTIELKEKQDKTQYRLFEEKGYCSITQLESGLIDNDDMIEWLDTFVAENDLSVKSITYDPAYASQALIKLSEKYTMIQLPQRPTLLSQPTRQLLYAIQNKELCHANNPLLTSAMYNSIVVEKQDLFAIDRTSNRNKIDPVDALINAWSEASYHEFDDIDLNEALASGENIFGW
ncbi:terminase large subunit [Enterococcus sp. AZ102]|uniref:terminase large subunit n=1 Tax=Enterococcus sp. AZ102 TaxID=2774865 RepID=UPI003F24567B